MQSSPNPVSTTLAYDEESVLSDQRCTEFLIETLDGLKIFGNDRNYILSMPTMCRWFYFMGAWIDDRHLRFQMSHAICLHSFGVKFLDDIIDDDTCCSNPTLVVVGVLMVDEAYAELAGASVLDDYFLHVKRPGVSLWGDQFALDTLPTGSLQAWRTFAEFRICRQMMFYANFLARHATLAPDPATVARLFHAIGEIWTMFDDFRDKEHDRRKPNNRHTNLALLQEAGLVQREAVLELLETLTEIVQVTISNHPPSLDFMPFFDRVVQRTRDYIVG